MYDDWIYKIAEKTEQMRNSRKVVLWGDYIFSQQIKDVLDKRRIPVYGYVESDQRKVDNEKVFPVKWLQGKNREYFVVIPLAFHQSIKDVLQEYFYSNDDYYYYNDCIIQNEIDYYEDNRGNRIIGRRGNLKIVFNGNDSTVKILGDIKRNQTVHSMDIGSNAVVEIGKGCSCRADFNVRNNANLKIGDNSTFGGKINLMDRADMCVKEGCYLEGKLFLRDEATLRVGKDCVIRANTMDIRDKTNCFIGNNVTTGENFIISVSDYTSLQIGDDCMFSHEVAIYTNDGHGIFDVVSGENINSTSEENASRKVVIGSHVWIGFRSMILYKTVIGNGSIIGAYSLVKDRFPNNCIAAGIPAKVIRRDVSWSRESGRDDIMACGMEYVNMTENI